MRVQIYDVYLPIANLSLSNIGDDSKSFLHDERESTYLESIAVGLQIFKKPKCY